MLLKLNPVSETSSYNDHIGYKLYEKQNFQKLADSLVDIQQICNLFS